LVTRTQYEPEVVTEIEEVVAPVDQRELVPAEGVSVTLPPEQKVVDPLGVIVGFVGSGLTVTTVVSDCGDVHPLPSVTWTQ
jgi:hypothetical protein